MARKLTEQERENIEAMRAALNDALPPAQRGIASGIASSLVRKPGDTVTEGDLDRILGKYEEADDLVRQAVKDTLLDVVEGQDGTYTVRAAYTASEEVGEDQSKESVSATGGDGESEATPGAAVASEEDGSEEAFAASVDDAGTEPSQATVDASAVSDAVESAGSPEAAQGEDAAASATAEPETEAAEEASPKPQRRTRGRARRTHKTAADKAPSEASGAKAKAGKAGKGKSDKSDRSATPEKAEQQPQQAAAQHDATTTAPKPSRRDDDQARDLRKVPYVRRGGESEAEVRQKIVALDKRFWMNGWLLSHPGAYTLYERELLAINDALSDGMLPGDITRRQLAYQMGGDEKFFEYGSNGFRLLRAMGMEDVIRHRPVPKPDLVYHAPRRRKHMRVLVTENLDPYLDVHDLMYEDGRSTILGERIHAVVLGGGTPVLEHNRLALLLDTLGADSITVLYWGDIDRAGLDIMVKLKEELGEKYKFRAFAPAYQLMVDKAMERFPDPADNETTGQINIEPADSSLLCNGLTQEAAAYAQAVIDDCGLIPQEILTKRDL